METSIERFIRVMTERLTQEALNLLGARDVSEEDLILGRIQGIADAIRFAQKCNNKNFSA